jgi:zinc transport system ATP-binding protein
MSEPPDIELKHVSFSYNGDTVLKDIDLEVPRLDFLAVIGPNGGGKTTLLKLILGLIRPAVGTVSVFGDDPRRASLRLGYVAQNTLVNPDFPIRVADVALMGRLGYPKRFRRFTAQDRDASREALETTGMSEFRDRKLGSLSGGQRQRVFIARALASNPDILLLDEPTSNIDPEGQRAIFELLKQLNERMTILVVGHDLAMLLGYAKTAAHVQRTLFLHHSPLLTPDLLARLAVLPKEHVCTVDLLAPEHCESNPPASGPVIP